MNKSTSDLDLADLRNVRLVGEQARHCIQAECLIVLNCLTAMKKCYRPFNNCRRYYRVFFSIFFSCQAITSGVFILIFFLPQKNTDDCQQTFTKADAALYALSLETVPADYEHRA